MNSDFSSRLGNNTQHNLAVLNYYGEDITGKAQQFVTRSNLNILQINSNLKLERHLLDTSLMLLTTFMTVFAINTVEVIGSRHLVCFNFVLTINLIYISNILGYTITTRGYPSTLHVSTAFRPAALLASLYLRKSADFDLRP